MPVNSCTSGSSPAFMRFKIFHNKFDHWGIAVEVLDLYYPGKEVMESM